MPLTLFQALDPSVVTVFQMAAPWPLMLFHALAPVFLTLFHAALPRLFAVSHAELPRLRITPITFFAILSGAVRGLRSLQLNRCTATRLGQADSLGRAVFIRTACRAWCRTGGETRPMLW